MRSSSRKKIWLFSIVLFLCSIALTIYWTPAFADNPIPLPVYGTETQPWSNATDEVSSAFSSAPVTESGFGTAPLPAEFSLLSPSHKAHFVQKTDYLVWTQISGAKWYRLHILGKNKTNLVKKKFKDIDVICFNGVCSIPLTSLEMIFASGQNYQWWVVAKVEGEKIKTNKWKFQLPSSDEMLHVASAELPFLYSEDFDGEVLSDIWYDRIYAVKSLQGDNAVYHVLGQLPITLPDGYIKDVALEAKVTLYGGRAILLVRGSGAGHYYAALNSTGEVELYRGDTVFAKSPQNLSIVPGQQYQLRISVIGNQITVTVDSSPVISITDPNPLPYGVATIGGDALKRNDVYIDDIQLHGTIADEPARGIDLISPLIQENFKTVRQDTSTSERIYFTRAADDTRTTIYSAGVNDTALQQDELRFRFGSSSEPSMSPDGTRLAFTSTFDGNTRVYFKVLSDGSIERAALKGYENGTSQQHPTWSPDSRIIYFVNNFVHNNNVASANVYTKQATFSVCGTNLGTLFDIALSPDGKQFAVLAGHNGVYTAAIYIVPFVPYGCDDASRIYMFPHTYRQNSSQFFRTPRWSTDGEYLSFTVIETDAVDRTTASRIVVSSVTRDIDEDENFQGFIVNSHSSISAPGEPDARMYLSPIWLPPISGNHRLAFIDQNRAALEARVVFASISSTGDVEMLTQHVDDAYGELSWGKGLFKPAYPQCISVSVTTNLIVRDWADLTDGASYIMTAGERFLAVGRKIVGSNTWLLAEEFYDANGDVSTDINVDYFGALWVLATDPNLDLDPAGDACDDDIAVNDPAKGYADDVYYLPLLNQPTATPLPPTSVPGSCLVQLTQNGVLREGPGLNYTNNPITVLKEPQPGTLTTLILKGRTATRNNGYFWYYVPNYNGNMGWIADLVLNTSDLEPPACQNLPLYDISTPTPPFPTLTPTATETSLPTATRGITPTPSPTPTESPRLVPTEAMPFQEMDDRVGLPLPFEIWPVTEGDAIIQFRQYGFGPNSEAYTKCREDPTPTPVSATPVPSDGTGCQYRGTSNIHTGIDYNTVPDIITVKALCDGVIVPAHNADNGGSARPTAGDGLALRCFANDPHDTDHDGFQNLSNIIVIYDHLDLNLGIAKNSYMVVQEEEELGTTTWYGSIKEYPPHLHIELVIAKNFREKDARIVLNPLLMYSTSLYNKHERLAAYPEDTPWTLQGMRWTAPDYWDNEDDPKQYFKDISSYLSSTYSMDLYKGPNCLNIPAGLSKTQLDEDLYSSCDIHNDDAGGNAAPTPTLMPQ